MRTTAKDLRNASGVTATSGSTTTKAPNLMSDWRKEVVQAAAEEFAEDAMWPALEQAIQHEALRAGQPLTKKEMEDFADAFHETHAAKYQAFEKQFLGTKKKTAKEEQAIIDAVIGDDNAPAYRAIVSKKRDPFSPLAANDPTARAKERMLWENDVAMVVVDIFAPVPKALVVPKAPVMFPVDAPAGLLEQLAQLAAEVSDAFMAAGAKKPAAIWVNPPQHVVVKQLHVHVQPGLPPFTNDRLSAKEASQDAGVRARMNDVFSAVEARLRSKLGPPVNALAS